MAKRSFHRKDRFYLKAKKEGYAARSAYKIQELDDRFKMFKKSSRVVELGAAPGGWFQVAQERMGPKGKLLAVDLLPLKVSPNHQNEFLQDDFTKESTQDWIRERCPQAVDWVISDMSPNISGIKFRDEFASYDLNRKAFVFACSVLKKGGGFLCKIFPGPEVEEFRKELKTKFKKMHSVVPEATRKSSTEFYLICLDYQD
ncbi:MAG: RlmE family RNA methyltransferase [Deltaproteobacteria bacterium]|nr:RlmE family RNA methyltransferase [Deltaproteobacteria bacterium]